MADNENKDENLKERAAPKPQALTEFQAWLEGVEEMQDDGWVPTKAQWDKIRERIKHIVPDDLPAPAPTRMGNNQYTLTPNNAEIPGYSPPPIVPSSIPNLPVDVEMSDAAKALLGDGGKTPDIDTSADGFASPFA